MQAFQYRPASGIEDALQGASEHGAKFVAGGTTLIDLMKLYVERPTALVDINHLPLNRIEPIPDGGLRIGAMVRNSDLAHNGAVQRDYAVLSQALLSGASRCFAIWPRRAATCFSELVVTTSATPRMRATSGHPGLAVPRWVGTIAFTRFSGRANTALPLIHPIWPSR